MKSLMIGTAALLSLAMSAKLYGICECIEVGEAPDSNKSGHLYFDLCKRICDKGIRLDAIGFQFHLFNRKTGVNFVQLEHWHPALKNTRPVR
ncbi:MAG: hypothetical protein IKO72_15845 [Kiritimatiellae bacterium]|nr:hypothetical protein [Kiritimatiellia bacterium]